MGRVPAVAPRRHIRNCEHFSVFFGSRRISRFPLTGETAAMLFSLRKRMVRCTSKHLGHPAENRGNETNMHCRFKPLQRRGMARLKPSLDLIYCELGLAYPACPRRKANHSVVACTRTEAEQSTSNFPHALDSDPTPKKTGLDIVLQK